jgi:hypothetical protein
LVGVTWREFFLVPGMSAKKQVHWKDEQEERRRDRLQSFQCDDVSKSESRRLAYEEEAQRLTAELMLDNGETTSELSRKALRLLYLGTQLRDDAYKQAGRRYYLLHVGGGDGGEQ